MKALIEEINEKLGSVLSNLENRKFEVEDALADIQDKIDEKIEEAKNYKTDVDASKEEIKKYEDEIKSLENDLKDLNERFSNKDLNAILETGNKEINNQIVLKQIEIDKERERIAEYTEKARMIKDLLVSLKKDKEAKKNKLSDLNMAFEYYSNELNKLMDYALENPDNLVEEEPTEEVEEIKYEFKNEPIVDDKVVFDAIESIENDEDTKEEVQEDNALEEQEESFEEEHKVEEPIYEEKFNEENTEIEEETSEEVEEKEVNTFDDNSVNIFNVAFDNEEPNQSETIEPEEEVKEEPVQDDIFAYDDKERVHEEDLYQNESNIVNLFNHDSDDSFDSFDFKALSDSIDKEYENIFGSSEEIKLHDEDDIFAVKNEEPQETLEQEETKAPEVVENKEEINLVDENASFDFFGNTEPIENIIEPNIFDNNVAPEKTEDNPEVVNFFKNNNIDFSKFAKEEQDSLIKGFNVVSYTKTLDILRKNNIKLDMIYGASKVFEMAHSELEAIINKLLLAGQSTLNISYVLNALPYIKTIDLQDVIDSYGENIKNANITDLVIKAKHLSELSGGNN